MNILVFVKQVPDSNEVKLDPVTGNMIRDNVDSKMNPPDAHAVEAALRLKEKFGGKVTAISMGPPQAEAVLKRARGMGCDDSVLLSDRAFGGADTLATAYVLSEAAKKIGDYDLLLFGRHAVDAETAQTGPAVASMLNIPQITLATSIEVEDGWVICDRMLENTVEKVKAKLPAMVSVCTEMNSARYPNVLKMNKNKNNVVWNAEELGCDISRAGVKGSPSYTKHMVEPETKQLDTVYFSGTDDEIAVKVADLIESQNLI